MATLIILGIIIAIVLVVKLRESYVKNKAEEMRVGDIFRLRGNSLDNPFDDVTNALQITRIKRSIDGEVFVKYIYIRCEIGPDGSIKIKKRHTFEWSEQGIIIADTFIYRYVGNHDVVETG